MAAFCSTLLLVSARVSAVVVATLVLMWAFAFQTSFLSRSFPENFIYSVLHPLLMVIGFIIVSGEAILVYTWLPGSRNFKKSMHLCLQGVALASGICGIWTKFYRNRGIVANFYSLHSWMGLICVILFASQWVVGFMSFWRRGEIRSARFAVLLPWHVFLGLYTYALAVATAETGLLEKLTFLQTRGLVRRHSPESVVVNCLGLGLALLGGIVMLAATSPKRRPQSPNIVYKFADGKWVPKT